MAGSPLTVLRSSPQPPWRSAVDNRLVPAQSLGKGNTPAACGQIGETVAFDRAIGVALDYRRSHPDTLIVVTADHGHTIQIVSEDAAGAGLPTGYSTNLTTKDGQT